MKADRGEVRGNFVHLVALTVITYCCGINAQVIIEPDDVTVCVGEGTVLLNCTLSSDNNIKIDDVQWYRTIYSTNTTEIVHVGSDGDYNSIFITTSAKDNLTFTTLSFANVTKSIAGYYWIRLSSDNVCNTSLSVQNKPATPMNIRFPPENTTNVSLIVQWDAVIDQFVDSYLVVWNNKLDTVHEARVNNTSYTITGLDPNTTYLVSVFAHNKCGDGTASIPENVTTNYSFTINTSLTTEVSVVIINPTSASTAAVPSESPFMTASTTISTMPSSLPTMPSSLLTMPSSLPTMPSSLPTSSIEAESDSDSGGSSAGVIAGGVIGGIVAVVVIVVTICIVAYCRLSVYKQKKDKADHDYDDIDNDDDENNAKSPFSRLELPNVSCACACLNGNDSNTGVLSATNVCAQHIDNPEHVYNDDPKHDDNAEHKDDPDTSKTKLKPQECVTIKAPCTVPGVAASKDIPIHPFAKMNTLQCSTNRSPHKILRVAHTMPDGARKQQLVIQQFGVHPYAVVDMQKIIEQAAKRLPLPLPPKDNQLPPLPAKTAATDDVHDEASNTSKPDDNPSHEITTDGLKCDASGDIDPDTNAEDAEKQFSYADLHPLPPSTKFIVTDDACVKYADVKK